MNTIAHQSFKRLASNVSINKRKYRSALGARLAPKSRSLPASLPSLAIAPRRPFSSGIKDTNKIRERAAIGPYIDDVYQPFTWKAAALFLGTGAGLLLYFKHEKQRVIQLREEQEKQTAKSVGKPKIGGPFTLTDCSTKEKLSNTDFGGRYYMVYFGFTNCPDICPDELDKMADVIDKVATDPELGNILTPVFITCDPKRDTPEIVHEYIQDFHPEMVGLTGTQEEITKVAKSFRVYVSSPPNVKEGEDYLVDHSIFFYLMDPEGKFVDCYAKDATADEVASSFKKYALEYKKEGGKVVPVPRKKSQETL
ncbi:hypothetical protein NQZ79_g5246 [Umbelopsis isabellina]|nr:hypothetical protein NQZ79_g5246 [Umbelopsis isabellina]